jgi:hypothetical protein
MATYIDFVPLGTSKSGKMLLWAVVSKEGRDQLGTVEWFSSWRKYAFMPCGSAVFEEVCLREISSFIEERTKEHRAKKKEETHA